MPLAVESLSPESSRDAVRAAISKSIEQCTHEGGRSNKECQGMVFAMVRRATGDGNGPQAQRKIRAGME